jgi:hypothetical protein
MATIITAHIASLRPNSVAVHGCIPVMASIDAIEGGSMPADPVAMRRALTTT